MTSDHKHIELADQASFNYLPDPWKMTIYVMIDKDLWIKYPNLYGWELFSETIRLELQHYGCLDSRLG